MNLLQALGCHHPRKRMIQYSRPLIYVVRRDYWMPACAGMTVERLAHSTGKHFWSSVASAER